MNTINFYTGKNGSGKSRRLYEEFNQKKNESISIINTPFSKFGRTKNILHVGSLSIINSINNSLIEILSLSDLYSLSEIGEFLRFLNFEPSVSLYVDVNKKNFEAFVNGQCVDYNSSYIDMNRVVIIDYLVQFIRGKKSRSSNYLLDNKIILPLLTEDNFFMRNDYIIPFLESLKLLKKMQIIRSYSFVFHKENKLLLNQLSSGEQTLLSMYFYILTNVREKDYIFIDEPENSLHPEWQFTIATLINAAIGYRNENVKIYVATHSPIVISGGVNEYKEDCSVYIIDQKNNDIQKVLFNTENNKRISVEDILWNAYESSPPANHFLSIQLNQLIHKYINEEITLKEAKDIIISFKKKIMEPKSAKSKSDNTQIRLIELVQANLDNLQRGN